MASARENDLNPNIYIGLSLPLKQDKYNDFALTKNSFEQAPHNLKNLLLTYVGERVAQPEFGSRLRELCFEQINDELPVRLDINIQEVNTLTDEGDQSKIFVEIKFSTTLNPQIFNSITLNVGSTTDQV